MKKQILKLIAFVLRKLKIPYSIVIDDGKTWERDYFGPHGGGGK